MNRIRQIGAAALSLTLLAASAPAMAGKIVCWTDDDGKRACGDRVPPKAARKERTVMDEDGRAREVKATGWLTKPFDPDQILGLVARLA